MSSITPYNPPPEATDAVEKATLFDIVLFSPTKVTFSISESSVLVEPESQYANIGVQETSTPLDHSKSFLVKTL